MLNHIITGTAGEDLSSSVGLVVYWDGADSEKLKVQDTDTATTNAGILTVGAADDGKVQVCFAGPVNAQFGGTVEPGDRVMVDSNGKLVTAEGTNSKAIFGQYLGSADVASGQTAEVFVFANKTTLTPAA